MSLTSPPTPGEIAAQKRNAQNHCVTLVALPAAWKDDSVAVARGAFQGLQASLSVLSRNVPNEAQLRSLRNLCNVAENELTPTKTHKPIPTLKQVIQYKKIATAITEQL